MTITWSDPWTIGWGVWIGLFVIWEGIALFNSKPGDTLSEHVWIWFGVDRNKDGVMRKKDGTVQLRRFVLATFVFWLGLHFLTGGWV